jgi:hypothetical protein
LPIKKPQTKDKTHLTILQPEIYLDLFCSLNITIKYTQKTVHSETKITTQKKLALGNTESIEMLKIPIAIEVRNIIFHP